MNGRFAVVLAVLVVTAVRPDAALAQSTAADPFGAIGPAHAAVPVGDWLKGDRKGKVRIVNCGGALCGTLIWLAEPNDPQTNKPKTDINNKDTSKQGRPLLGMPVLLNMRPSTPDKWEGPIYNAEDGLTYAGSVTLHGPNTAELKGCVMSVSICKGQTWMRAPAAAF